MASAEHKPIRGSRADPQRGPGAEPLIRGSGAEPPETESFLGIGHPKEGAQAHCDTK